MGSPRPARRRWSKTLGASTLPAWLGVVFIVGGLQGRLLLGAQEVGAVSGVVMDRQASAPVADAIVRVGGVSTITAGDGRFTLPSVPAGEGVLSIEHLAYGDHSETIVIEPGRRLQVEVKISQQAIELAPLLVEALSELESRRLTSGHSINEIVIKEIDDASRRGLTLPELLRQGLPSVSVRGNCVEYRGARLTGGRCREMAVMLDGVPVSAPGLLMGTMPLQDIERLEVLSPGEAGARYGLMSGYGVLVIETKTGPARDQRRAADDRLAGFDWSLEAGSYPWARVMASSFVGNALGVGVGLLVGDQCLRISDSGFTGLRPKCSALLTMGASFITLGLPGLAGSTAARWAGATGRSRGRLVPSALLGSLTVASGYLLWVNGTSLDSGLARATGATILIVGAPVFTALSDRLFRYLR